MAQEPEGPGGSDGWAAMVRAYIEGARRSVRFAARWIGSGVVILGVADLALAVAGIDQGWMRTLFVLYMSALVAVFLGIEMTDRGWTPKRVYSGRPRMFLTVAFLAVLLGALLAMPRGIHALRAGRVAVSISEAAASQTAGELESRIADELVDQISLDAPVQRIFTENETGVLPKELMVDLGCQYGVAWVVAVDVKTNENHSSTGVAIFSTSSGQMVWSKMYPGGMPASTDLPELVSLDVREQLRNGEPSGAVEVSLAGGA